ncbi:hypothetical protein D0N36_04030 [Hymenobacter lapidiphilus]|uniref:hypothetical protein n=1 Tax=Hymenobacter sp. CCM 8763 TaxID=2303334 RepID=UPI000E344E35|nr:hypothetical protein [Hymenobacter sp. CCM 8763]RFP66525.1 hypothetical protein D0N36_04030 [Hymenobacter sp. CCM 8763]
MKKIRGFNRNVRLTARDCALLPDLSAAHLRQFHYDYAKLRLGPLHRFRHARHPLPQVVRQLGATYLLKTLQRWQQQLAPLTEPVYAAIWLADTDFVYLSQVVVGTQGRIEWYENTFGDAVPAGPLLPPEYRALPGADQLTWTTHRQQKWLDADNFPHGWPARLLRQEHTVRTLEVGRSFLVIPHGWVWVGRAPHVT